MSNRSAARPDPGSNDPEFLAAIEDGCGCVETWEALSERRREDGDGG